ncbi:MAG: signal peptidase I [Candidatus Magasanikbacteria bacterium]
MNSSVWFFQRHFWRVISGFFFFIFVLSVIRFFIFSPGSVNGRSMESTYLDNDFFLVNKFSYLFRPPERYDIVQVLQPDTGTLIIKRLVGLPGETISIRRGKVFVDKHDGFGQIELEESYLDPNTYTVLLYQQGALEFELEDNYYFVLGDNREHSTDSRVYGPVHRSKIIGNIFFSKR